MLPQCHPRPALQIEQFDGLSVHVRAQMGIAHRHIDGRVSEKFLDSFERYATHHEVTCERMAQVVPSDSLREACSLAGPRNDALYDAVA